MKGSMFSITLLLLAVAAVDGFGLVGECVLGVTQFPVPCCPYFRGTRCGIGEGRGQCSPRVSSRAEPEPDVMIDERDQYPNYFHNWTCVCRLRFYGFHCGFCLPGWTGDRCDIAKTIYRVDILSLSIIQLNRFHSMLHSCKNKIDNIFVILQAGDRLRARSYSFKRASFYDVAVFYHFYATRPFVTNGREASIINFAHGSAGFLGWHRYWLFMMEFQLQRCMEDEYIALPYFTWETYQDCPICNDIYFGANNYFGQLSEYSLYSDWRVMCANDYPQTLCLQSDCVCERAKIVRLTGLTSVTKPGVVDFNRCFNISTFDSGPFDATSFGARSCYERVHNNYHGYHGGIMNRVQNSASDPLFFLHHCNMDRHYENYIQEYKLTPDSYPNCNVYGHRARDCIFPSHNCMMNKDMMTPIVNYGVVYVTYTP